MIDIFEKNHAYVLKYPKCNVCVSLNTCSTFATLGVSTPKCMNVFAFQPYILMSWYLHILQRFSLIKLYRLYKCKFYKWIIFKIDYSMALLNKLCCNNHSILTWSFHIINEIKIIVAYLIDVDGQYWLMHSWQNSAMTFNIASSFRHIYQ